LKIFPPTKYNQSEWDKYVKKSPEATFYHQWAWKRVVEKALGHDSCYLAAEKQGNITGIFPLFTIRPPFGKPFLTSIPAANYGGICADDRETALALMNKAKALADEQGAAYMEMRDFFPKDYGLSSYRSYVTVLIPLFNEPEQVWHGLRKSVRNAVRKAVKSGIQIHIDAGNVPIFYKLYSRNMQRIGSPCFGPGLFEAVLNEFPNTARMAWAKLGSKIVAADLIVLFKDSILSLYAGTDEKYLNLGTNSLLTWEEIRFGCENGFAYYDFGRSTFNSGSYEFKKRWNGEIHQLCYHYYLTKGNRLPVKNPAHPVFKTASAVWRKLPVFLTQQIGPMIVKYLH